MKRIVFIIHEPSGRPIIDSLREYRKDCITQFMEEMDDHSDDWKKWSKHGWKCIKTEITLNYIKNGNESSK